MEGSVLGRSDDQGSEMKEDKLEMSESSNGEKRHRGSEETAFEDDLLESTKAEMGQVREENKRLKLYLDQMMRDYNALQKHCSELMTKEGISRDKNIMSNNVVHSHNHLETDQESELVSLSLGRSVSSDSKKEDDNKIIKQDQKIENAIGKIEEGGLALGLDCKFEATTRSETIDSLNHNSSDNNNKVISPESSFEGPKEGLNEEMWPPSKVLKTMRSGDSTGDEVSHQQNPVKKARVCVRARCDAPTMNDGCQWRKYGQKIAKGNPCPRAYYRCTVAPSCPVRKQVQRCADDMSILITTYEGTHNHPLAMAATAMASTTSAAARMLLSGASSSGQAIVAPLSSTTATTTFSGLSIRPSEFSRPGLIYFPSTTSSISSSTCPTVTLDLTSSNPLSSSSLSSLPSSYYSSQFGRFSPNYLPTSRLSSSSISSLSFTSPTEPSNALPFTWTNNNDLMPSYGTPLLNKNNHVVAMDHQLGSQSNLQRSGSSSFAQPSLPADTIVAATKAITADPNFQSVLAAALKSIIGNSNGGGTSGN